MSGYIKISHFVGLTMLNLLVKLRDMIVKLGYVEPINAMLE